jgi:hypothetical protein
MNQTIKTIAIIMTIAMALSACENAKAARRPLKLVPAISLAIR